MSTGIDVNFDGVDAAAGFEVVPPGKYLASVKTAEVVTSQRAGTPGLQLTFEIVGGDYAGGEIRDTLWLSGKAMPFVRQRLEALGVKIPSGPWRLTPELVIGKRATLTCREEEYTGNDGQQKKSLRVKAYEPAARLGGQAASAGGGRDYDIPF